MSLTLTMWPASYEHNRLEHEMIRDAQEIAYTNGRAANGIVPSQSARPRDSAQYSMVNRQIQPVDQIHPSQFLPGYMGADSMCYFNSSEAQGSFSTFTIHPHSAGMNTARLLRIRDERRDERLGLNTELARQSKVDGNLSVAAAQLERDDKAYSPSAFFDASRLPPQVNGTYRPPVTNDKSGVHASYTEEQRYQAKEEQAHATNEEQARELEDSLASKRPPKSRKRAAEEQPRKSKKKDTKWLISLEELKEYKKEYGNTIVPRGYSENPRLASWVAEQRKQFKLLHDKKQSSITQERIDLLNELDFAWTRHMSDLRSFQAETGHCHVPLNHDKYPRLGLWVKEQRRHHTLMTQGKPSHMTAERCSELNTLGFCYDTHESTWMDRWRELAEYREQNGSCVVPSNYHNTKLSTWVHHQRRQFKRLRTGQPCHITEDRIRLLNQLGFIWYPRQSLSDADDDSSSDEEGDELTYLSDNEDEETSSPNKKSKQKKRARQS